MVFLTWGPIFSFQTSGQIDNAFFLDIIFVSNIRLLYANV